MTRRTMEEFGISAIHTFCKSDTVFSWVIIARWERESSKANSARRTPGPFLQQFLPTVLTCSRAAQQHWWLAQASWIVSQSKAQSKIAVVMTLQGCGVDSAPTPMPPFLPSFIWLIEPLLIFSTNHSVIQYILYSQRRWGVICCCQIDG